jgi:CRISPR-associated protein Csx17
MTDSLALAGCTPEPLMNYLKALGVFRLVAEQKDPSATLSWEQGIAHLGTRLDHDDLCTFLVNDYRPTPVFNPWGGRSGFYPDKSETAARDALAAISQAPGARFDLYKQTISAIRAVLKRMSVTTKKDLESEQNYLRLLRSCRNELPDAVLPWMDAVLVLTDEDCKFPPILGTGGNEGSGSYTSTFAQLVVELLVNRRADSAITTSLFDEPGAVLSGVSVGQFNPGAVGGPNSGQGFAGGGGVNLWDYLFALEGALLFSGAAVRRLGFDMTDKVAFPFTVNPVAVGYGSAAAVEETSDGSRAELWVPLWSGQATLAELAQLFAEGRAQVGRRQARNAIEFALAACLLGISRGITAFIRYGLVKRNGLSFFAAPLGRVPVTPRPRARLLADPRLTEWLERLRSACRDKDKTPARYQSVLRNIDRAMFEFATRAQTDAAAEATSLLTVLRALGRAERTLAGGLAFCKEKYIRPLQGLSPQWLDQANDKSPEFRLAMALAGVRGEKESVGPLRVHLEPVALNRACRFEWDNGSTSVVWSNRPLDGNLAAAFLRRQMEAFRTGFPGVPLGALRPARLADVLAFLNEETDDEKLHDLLWGLSTVSWSGSTVDAEPTEVAVPVEFGIPRLLVEPITLTADHGCWKVGGTDATVPDSDIFQPLAPAQPEAIRQCVDRAARRLKSGGWLVVGYRNRRQSGKSLAVVSRVLPHRLLAAYLFPLSRPDLEVIANAVLYPPETQE